MTEIESQNELKSQQSYIQEIKNSVTIKLQNKEALTILESIIWFRYFERKFGNHLSFKNYIHQNTHLHESIKKHYANYIFQQLLCKYATDLSFKSDYYYYLDAPSHHVATMVGLDKKLERISYQDGKIKKEHIDYRGQNGILLDRATIEFEKAILEKNAEEWANVITNDRHSDQNLQRICTHARREKNRIEKLFKTNQISLTEKTHQLNLNLWKTKWVYFKGCEIVEMIKDEFEFPLILTLKEKKIYYTFDSIVHILNRHFAQLISPNREKSFHEQYHFELHFIHITLQHLFNIFDGCTLLRREHLIPNNPLNFELDGRKYQLYFKEFNGLFQVDSLYPLKNEDGLIKLQNYNLVKMGDPVSLYVKK